MLRGAALFPTPEIAPPRPFLFGDFSRCFVGFFVLVAPQRPFLPGGGIFPQGRVSRQLIHYPHWAVHFVWPHVLLHILVEKLMLQSCNRVVAGCCKAVVAWWLDVSTLWSPYVSTLWSPYASTLWSPYASTLWSLYASTLWPPYASTLWSPYVATSVMLCCLALPPVAVHAAHGLSRPVVFHRRPHQVGFAERLPAYRTGEVRLPFFSRFFNEVLNEVLMEEVVALAAGVDLDDGGLTVTLWAGALPAQQFPEFLEFIQHGSDLGGKHCSLVDADSSNRWPRPDWTIRCRRFQLRMCPSPGESRCRGIEGEFYPEA